MTPEQRLRLSEALRNSEKFKKAVARPNRERWKGRILKKHQKKALLPRNNLASVVDYQRLKAEEKRFGET